MIKMLFLAMFIALMGVSVRKGVTSVALQTSANNGSTGGITCPTVQAGDVLVFIDGTDASGTINDTYPSGFTPIVTTYDPSPNFTRRSASYKIATGSEGGSNIDGHDGTTCRHVLLVFRGDRPITSVTIGSLDSEVTASNPAAQNCAASGGSAPLAIVAGYASSAAISPRTFSPAQDAEITPATTFYVLYKIYNSAPANTSIDMDQEGVGNSLMSWYMEFA